MNIPFTTQEAVRIALREVAKLKDDGACSTCALRVVAKRYDLDHDRLLDLYIDDALCGQTE